MTQKKYSTYYVLNQKVAASKLGSWIFSRTFHHLDRMFLKVTGGRMAMTTLVAGLPIVTLTVTGAKSGLPRSLPLVAVQDEQDATSFALIASNWGQQHYPSWYYNLKANPRATCVINGKTGQYIAHEAVDEEYKKFWQYAVDTYVGYPLYKQRISGRGIPIMVMLPQKS